MRKYGLITGAGAVIVRPGAVPYLLDYDVSDGSKTMPLRYEYKVAYAPAYFPILYRIQSGV